MRKELTDLEKIKLLYDSLSSMEEITFDNRLDKMKFNKYMLYLNYLESQGKIKVKMIENCSKREWKIIVEKL
ncbi:hypothetical protein [Fusobacterium sp. SYSU M8D902]|uniref:hypothetical protein n=1 Tax=Fusobacterium sp. SYSU M8D902 TaxID=3159562 RepID=UPI0032E3A134